MSKGTKTVVNGQSYQEELTFEQLSDWHKGRWLAGQGEAADSILERAKALVKAQFNDDAFVERDEGTGELKLVNELIIGGPSGTAPGGEQTSNLSADEKRKALEASLKKGK